MEQVTILSTSTLQVDTNKLLGFSNWIIIKGDTPLPRVGTTEGYLCPALFQVAPSSILHNSQLPHPINVGFSISISNHGKLPLAHRLNSMAPIFYK
jgi:hypothetical protein